MRVSREFKLGILVVLTFLFLFIGINFLKTFDSLGEVREFTVEFDKSDGLEVNDRVVLSGVAVGKVKAIDLHPQDANRVIVRFSVDDNDVEIPRETQLWLMNSDILGTKVLDLRVPPDSLIKHPDKVYKNGEQFDPDYVHIALAMDDELEAQFLPIRDKAEELIERVENIIFKVSAYWDNSGAYAFDASMYEVRDAIERYKEMTINLTELVKRETYQTSLITSDIRDFREELRRDSVSFVQISTNFSQLVQTFDDSLLTQTFKKTGGLVIDVDQRLRWIGKGNGTVGKFAYTTEMKDQITQIDTAFTTLKWHLQARPKDFVGFSIFGLKAKGYQPDKNKEPYLEGMLDSLENGKRLEYK